MSSGDLVRFIIIIIKQTDLYADHHYTFNAQRFLCGLEAKVNGS